jgi:hypothetical protein
MNYDDIRQWCHAEMRAPSDSPMYARGRAILALLDIASSPPWLADLAEALGEVRPDDGAPLALNWTQVIEAIRDLRDDRDSWKSTSESWRTSCVAWQDWSAELLMLELRGCGRSRAGRETGE